jgi:hypothetical protein
LNLPDDANQDSIKASFKNGVLTVTIDKREVSAPERPCFGALTSRLSIVTVSTPFLNDALIESWLASSDKREVSAPKQGRSIPING